MRVRQSTTRSGSGSTIWTIIFTASVRDSDYNYEARRGDSGRHVARRLNYALLHADPIGPAAASACGSICRAKHSTLDWFDKEFTVVAGPLGNDWLEAGRQVSEKSGSLRSLKQLPQAASVGRHSIGLRGAVLVRPDGHVAWRMPYIPSDPARELAGALERVLH